MTETTLTFTPAEMKQLKGATNAWLLDVARLERSYSITLTETIGICAGLHRKVLEACGDKT